MSKIRLHGSSSGYTEIAPVAASGNNTLTLPNDGTIISKDANGAVGVTSMKASNVNVGAAVTITESGIEASGIGITCANINGGQIGGRRNIIINGAMQVAQRGTSSTSITSSANLYKTLDRWTSYVNDSGTYTNTKATVTDLPGFNFSNKWEVTAADASVAANSYLLVGQTIERNDLVSLAKGTSSAKSTTISFYVKCSITGTFVVELSDVPNTRGISTLYTINSANTWERKVITFPGDTSGTMTAAKTGGISVFWWLHSGSTHNSGTLQTSWQTRVNANRAVGITNLGSTNGATWEITGVQWEIGSQATDFEHRSIGEEIELCKRYYQKSYPSDIPPGSVGNGEKAADFVYLMGGAANPHFMHQFHPEMRTTPTVTHYSVQNANTTGKITASTTDYSITGTNTNFNCATRYIIYVASGVTAADDVYSAWAADSEL